MSKIGFVDCLSNAFDSFEIATTVVDQSFAGTNIQRLTAPEVLKVPVCVKKLLASDVDLVVAFVTASAEDFDSLHLVVEKTIDLELEFQKYVFYCVVTEQEYSNEEEFREAAKAKLQGIFDLAMKALSSPQDVSSQIGSGLDFSLFASFAEGGAAQQAPQEDTHSLF